MKKRTNSLTYYVTFFAGLALFSFIVLNVSKEPEIDQYAIVTVKAGDTLWGLANEYQANHQLSTVDFIDWVEKQNNIEKKDLKEGEEIYIPVLKNKLNNTLVAKTQ
ncbi:cell division suppressor protein YneA [Priestia endophytica]|jgi:cell division protein YceG involved in septum cleavage|uniref:cell division suppressor protein YneA n=1 Tax=Priestia endophytica TaxID=135735 RepID=UPI000DCA5B0D|nr:LysM peptidoglycan-binding domain-containing protein [Priestia endophytica]RAS86784.1 hypothetical protein A4R27_00185 [Priestia endophytica]